MGVAILVLKENFPLLFLLSTGTLQIWGNEFSSYVAGSQEFILILLHLHHKQLLPNPRECCEA